MSSTRDPTSSDIRHLIINGINTTIERRNAQNPNHNLYERMPAKVFFSYLEHRLGVEGAIHATAGFSSSITSPAHFEILTDLLTKNAGNPKIVQEETEEARSKRESREMELLKLLGVIAITGHMEWGKASPQDGQIVKHGPTVQVKKIFKNGNDIGDDVMNVNGFEVIHKAEVTGYADTGEERQNGGLMSIENNNNPRWRFQGFLGDSRSRAEAQLAC